MDVTTEGFGTQPAVRRARGRAWGRARRTPIENATFHADMDSAETAALVACGVSGSGGTLRGLLRLHTLGRIVLAPGRRVVIGVYVTDVTAWT